VKQKAGRPGVRATAGWPEGCSAEGKAQNQNIFLNGAILGMRKAEPERRGGAEIGCRRQARRALRVGRTANQIARKFDEIVEFSGCARLPTQKALRQVKIKCSKNIEHF
jgi:hypothetical protein